MMSERGYKVARDSRLTPAVQTDASRSRLIESQVQARVAAELKALEKQQNEALVAAHAKLAAAPADDKDGKESKMSNAVVGKQLEGLRGKLEARKQLRDLPGEVEAARGDMVRCLTENDRRPLDCYAEVQRFKAEVRKMEQEWVNRVTA